ncbi:MAG: nicotinamide riboside transporter PnuC [Ruminococcus sp.]|nr:nicotinamide riboside transporter PnuC [Ruminococcus sp.]
MGVFFYGGHKMRIRNPFKSLNRTERVIWGISIVLVTLSYFLGGGGILSLTASVIGVTALIFVSKGDVFGQEMTVIFSLLYAVISYGFSYYGEMITYLGMTAPTALLSVISWLKNPYEGDKTEVRVAALTLKKVIILFTLTSFVTFVFYFILKYFNTANLIFSTVSVFTSFLAGSLTFLRSSYYAIAYGANDIVLIILWILAALENPSYLPMIICFAAFLMNDLYGFVNWRKIQARQSAE